MSQKWACHGKEVIISSIASGIFMEPLKNVAKLMALCDEITIMKTQCNSCLGTAIFSYRTSPFPENESPNSPAFFLGGFTEYATLCRRCFIKRIACDQEMKIGMFSNKAINKLERSNPALQFNTTVIGKR
jgi:thymidine kinase